MAELEIAPGVLLDGAEAIEVSLRPIDQAGVLRRSAGGAADDREAALADALGEAGFDTLADTTVASAPGRRAAAQADAALKVVVGPDEDAVLLVEETGGVFRWVLPQQTENAAIRRGSDAGARTLVFPLEAQAGGGPGRRDALGSIAEAVVDQLIDPVRVRVLRYLAARGIDAAVRRVEGDVVPSLMIYDSKARGWTRATAPPPIAPVGRPPRVLLMVHGTFSSTGSSFAALDMHPEGQRFLADALDHYDCIIGYDHKTLADDAETNARGLLAAIEGLPSDTKLDAVAYSRGGLVYRAFAELLAPDRFDHGRVVFVGCTNGGTHLADPANWRRLIDVYTNTLMAGAQVIGAMTSGAVTPFLTFAIRTIGRFVQALPEVGIDDGRVPGLAAMRPDSATVAQLNGAAAGAPGPARYCVIGADFEPRIDAARGIGGALARYLADQVADGLFPGENDMVVDTPSMSMFGGLDARHDTIRTRFIAPDEAVYHTIYFASESVCRTLGDWLLDRPQPVAAAPVAAAPAPAPMAQPAPKEPPMPAPMGSPARSAWPGLRLRELFGTRGDAAPGAAQPGLRRSFTEDAGTQDQDVWAMPSAEPAPGPSVKPVDESHDAALAAADEVYRTEVAAAADAFVPPPMPVATEARRTTVACHFAAEMDRAPDIARPAPLFVTVSREEIVAQVNAAVATTAQPVAVDAGRPIRIEVIALENCAVEGDSGCDIAVPDAGLRPATLRFMVRGFAMGAARIQVEARQGPLILADFTLSPVFVDTTQAKLSVAQVSQVPLAGGDPSVAVLRIYEIKQQDGSLLLRYDLASRKPSIGTVADQVFDRSFSMGAFTAMLLQKLNAAYKLSQRKYQTFLDNFVDEAATATQDLIPEAIRRDLWRCRSKVNIQVISNSPYIPWEILYLDDPDNVGGGGGAFLCELGLIRWMYNARAPSDILPLRADRVRYVVPDYANARNQLAEAAAERAMLTDHFKDAQALPADSPTLRGFLRDSAKTCDLLHFACHGEAKTDAVLNSSLILAGSIDTDGTVASDSLTYQTVDRHARFSADEPSGLVFVNACQTGRTGEGIAGVAGFAEAFLRPQSGRGAAAFVGALWSVDDHLALGFATAFYDRLLAGDTLAQATQAARDRCKANEGDFTWLAYSVYGNPDARVG